MKKLGLTWVSAGMITHQNCEFGTKEEVEKVFSEFPSEYVWYEGEGEVRDHEQHKTIVVNIYSVPSDDMGHRILAYPKQNY